MSINITEITAQQTLDLRHSVMWPNKPIDYVKLPKDEKGLHFGLWKNEKLVSVISLFIDGNSAQFRKFATDINEQGNGFGSQLLSHLFEVCKSKNISKIWCNARIDKTSFYERFGMNKTSKTFVKGGLEYVVMEKRHELHQ